MYERKYFRWWQREASQFQWNRELLSFGNISERMDEMKRQNSLRKTRKSDFPLLHETTLPPTGSQRSLDSFNFLRYGSQVLPFNKDSLSFTIWKEILVPSKEEANAEVEADGENNEKKRRKQIVNSKHLRAWEKAMSLANPLTPEAAYPLCFRKDSRKLRRREFKFTLQWRQRPFRGHSDWHGKGPQGASWTETV